MPKKQKQKIEVNNPITIEVENPIIALCDRMTSNGETLSITWEGGEDSGGYTLLLNGEDISPQWGSTEPNDVEKDRLINYIADHMDYGSFAGSFYTSGELFYNREDKSFSGDDHYSETEGGHIPFNYSTVIPSSIWFDNIRIEMSGGSEGQIDTVNFEFFVTNGFKTTEHDAVAEKIIKELEAHLNKVYSECKGFHIDDIDSTSHHDVINISQLQKNDEGTILCIDNLDVHKRAEQDKSVDIQLQ